MITIPLWMRAVETQLEAIAFCDWFVTQRTSPVMEGESIENFEELHQLQSPVKIARPFGWSNDSIQAVIEASASIPDDTPLNSHNLGDKTVFWWLERPLRIPYKHLQEVHAIVGSWGRNGIWALKPGQNVFTVTLWYKIDATHVFPGHFWWWTEGQSLSEPINNAKIREVVTPDVNSDESKQLLNAVPKIGKFLLAAFAWLDQKILTVTEENGERHARKRYEKVVKQWHPVQIVQLRKRVYQHPDGPTEGESRSSPAYRFVVHGHWRNQSCGPHHSDRKLIYIMPFLKGDEDAPFRPKLKVYEVTR